RREDFMTPMTAPSPRQGPGLTPSVVRVYGDGRFHTDGELLALAFAADGSLWSIEEPGVLRLWDLATGQSRDWRFLSDVETWWVFDVARGRGLGALEGHTDRIQALAWHPQGTRLLSAGWDTTARVWDSQRFEPIILLTSHASQVSALAFSPDGELLVCADSDAILHVWEFATHRVRHLLKGHHASVQCLAFHPNGQALVSGGNDRVIHLWAASQG